MPDSRLQSASDTIITFQTFSLIAHLIALAMCFAQIKNKATMLDRGVGGGGSFEMISGPFSPPFFFFFPPPPRFPCYPVNTVPAPTFAHSPSTVRVAKRAVLAGMLMMCPQSGDMPDLVHDPSPGAGVACCGRVQVHDGLR